MTAPTKIQKAIGYVRVSTEQQANEGVSLEAQKAKIEAWCEFNGYELENVFVDAGISGKEMTKRNRGSWSSELDLSKRKGLQNALDAMKKGHILVVYSLSRLTRSVTDLLTISEVLVEKQCDLASIVDKIDTSSAMGKFFFKLAGCLSELERELIVERTKTALAKKRSNGEVYSPIPFGYKAFEGRLIEVENETKIVAEMIQMRQEGVTLQAIADSLNARGITGKNGGKWQPASVRYVINNNKKVA